MVERSRLSLALLFGAGALFVAAYATAVAVASNRGALLTVVRVCAADERLAGRPFPCLAVDLAGGEERGHIVLRPPWSNDMILSPTRRSVGVEDPFLQSKEAPNYFAEAWRARSLIATADGSRPSRDQIALIANSRRIRVEDQLHIHIGCLVSHARRFLAEAAETLPPGAWRQIGPVVPGSSFWALKVRSADLTDVDPFRLVQEKFGRAVKNPADLMVAAVGAEVAGEKAFLILTSIPPASRSLRPAGSDVLIDRRCRGDEKVAG